MQRVFRVSLFAAVGLLLGCVAPGRPPGDERATVQRAPGATAPASAQTPPLERWRSDRADLIELDERGLAVAPAPSTRTSASTIGVDAFGRFPDDGPGILYAMAYYPQTGGETERANSLAELYGAARPGYGLYTFVIGGAGGDAGGGHPDAYGELMRTIETYVVGGGDATARRDSHVFLVPVRATSEPGELAERARPELSAQMRDALVRQLRLYGHVVLADQLERSPGPFLITSTRPVLVPRDADAPRLVVDLSHIGPEYFYPLVDAYDRPISPETLGRSASLEGIRQRVIEMVPNQASETQAASLGHEPWMYLLEGPGAKPGMGVAAGAHNTGILPGAAAGLDLRGGRDDMITVTVARAG